MITNEEGHLVLENGRVITSPKVISLVKAFDALKLQDFQPLIPDLREKWNIPEDQDIQLIVPGLSETIKVAQTEFDVVLTASGSDRMGVIKLIKETTGASLVESKGALDKLPFTLKQGASQNDADTLAGKFKAAGASVEVK